MVKFGWDKLKRFLAQANTWSGTQTFSSINVTGGTIAGATITENFTTLTDPATNAAVTTAIVNSYNGVIVTLTAAGNTQTLQSPTTTATIRKFMVINNDTSNNSLSVVANSVTFTLTAGEGQCFLWDGSAWGPTDLGITEIPVNVTQGGTGRSTGTTAYSLIASGTTATGAQQTLANGATTEVLVGGGASALPVWGTNIPTAVTIGGAYIYRAGGTDVPVADGGTGASTLTDHGVLLGSGTGAITPMTALAAGEIIVGVGGADPHALAAGATTKILVGGGAADPVWTTATGSGAPVRATAPTIASPSYTGTFGFAPATELTIATGAITAAQTIHLVDTESDAATDDLVTINGGADGLQLEIRAAHADRTVVIKETGNILTGGSDIRLDDTNKYILFTYDGALSKWVVVGGSGGVGFATAAEITAGTEAAKAVAPDQLKLAGIIPANFATAAEIIAGTEAAKAVAPDQLKYVLDRLIPQCYGVSWDESADTYVRTGFTAGQTCGVTLDDAFLPVHRRMRGCVVTDAGVVAYYLCATDWTKKEDGITASDLTGTDGQVMVEIPKFWYRYGYSGTTHTWEVSPVPLTGFKVHEAFLSDTTEKDYLYVGAYEASLYDVSASKYVGQCYQYASAVFDTSDDSITIATRTGWATNLVVGQKLVITGTSNNNTTVTVKAIVSATKITVDENLTDETASNTIIQTQTDVTDTNGDKLSSVSGVCPITGGSANGTRAHFRTWAENRGGGKATNDAAAAQWSQLYGDANSALQLLYLTEYASFYSQSVLGYGIAAVGDWAAYNYYNPIAKSGNGNATGNASGNTATAAITTGAGATSVYLKYRGIENLYGHIWKFVDGYKVNDDIPYLCNNFANFSDAESTDNYTNPTDVNGAAITMHNANGYQGTLELTGRAFMPASLTGGSASAKITDYYYQYPFAGWHGVMSGGFASDAADVGAFYLHAANALADVFRNCGGRLVCRK